MRILARNEVVGNKARLDRRKTQIAAEPMTLRVDVAVVVTEADTRPCVRGIAGAGPPHVPVRRLEHDIDRHRLVHRLVTAWAHLDAAEIATVAQAAVDRCQLARMKRLTLPGLGQFAHEILVQRLFAESQLAEPIARPALRLDIDLGHRLVGIHTQLLPRELEVEIATLGGKHPQPLLYFFVLRMVEHRTLGQWQRRQQLSQPLVAGRITQYHNIALADGDRRPQRDDEAGLPAVAPGRQIFLDLGLVEAERTKRRIEFLFGTGKQAPNPPDRGIAGLCVQAQATEQIVFERILCPVCLQHDLTCSAGREN